MSAHEDWDGRDRRRAGGASNVLLARDFYELFHQHCEADERRMEAIHDDIREVKQAVSVLNSRWFAAAGAAILALVSALTGGAVLVLKKAGVL